MRRLTEIVKDICAKEIKVKEAQSEVNELKGNLEAFDKSEVASEDEFDDMLDEQGDIEIVGIRYNPSNVLKNVDPAAYQTEFNNWVDSLDEESFPEYVEMREELEEAEDILADLENELEELNDEKYEAAELLSDENDE